MTDDDGYEREEYLADLRGLVMTGGKPYILITVEDEAGGVDLSHFGIDPTHLPTALREIAEQLEAA